jgi:hypothetical protein
VDKLKKLKTPAQIQDFLNKMPFNFERHGETHNSVEVALKRNKAHCFEGALIAAAALWVQGRKPLLLDLKTVKPDFDHVVAPFQEGKYWGAISKTNHNVLRYREPIYRDIRELALSYFHEYFLADGKKTLRKYSKPFDLTHLTQPSPRARRGQRRSPGEVIEWISGSENLAWLAHELDQSPHQDILTPTQIKHLRKADKVEVGASGLVEWKRR